jgi:hypothetical protein
MRNDIENNADFTSNRLPALGWNGKLDFVAVDSSLCFLPLILVDRRKAFSHREVAPIVWTKNRLLYGVNLAAEKGASFQAP